MLKDKNKELLKYIGPGIVGLLFNSLYIIVDGIFVSKILGSNALAAVTVIVPVVEILIAISLMISIGCGIYISSNKGKGDLEASRDYFNHGFLLTIFISLVITILFIIFNKTIVKLLGATNDILNETQSYFFWFTIFIPFFMLNYSLGTWIRNDNKPELAMVGQVIGAILNIVLDYIFMAKLNMGIKGAAIATGLGPIIGIIILLPHFLRKKGDLYFEKIKIQWVKIKKILIAGIPSFAIEFSLGVMTFFCNIFIARKFKETGLSAFGIIGYINLIVLSVYLGIGQGTQPLISLYNGQNKYNEINLIYKFCLKLSILIGIISYVILLLNKTVVLSIFTNKNDLDLIKLTLDAIDLFFITLPITGINIVTASIFEAKQDLVPSLLISFSRSIIFLLPILAVLNNLNHPMLLWIAVPIAELITLFLALYLWKVMNKI